MWQQGLWAFPGATFFGTTPGIEGGIGLGQSGSPFPSTNGAFAKRLGESAQGEVVSMRMRFWMFGSGNEGCGNPMETKKRSPRAAPCWVLSAGLRLFEA